MPLTSSPVAYLPSSSPPAILEKRKRPLPNDSPREAKRRFSEQRPGELTHAFDQENTISYPSPEPSSDNENDRIKAGIATREPIITQAIRVNEDPKSNPLKSLGKSLFRKCYRHTALPSHDVQQAAAERHFQLRTASGKAYNVKEKAVQTSISYEQLIASRSTTEAGKAEKSYYGIDIHQLLDQACNDTNAQRSRPVNVELPQDSVEQDQRRVPRNKRGTTKLWTEKYRARRFTDLVGDERTHRTVLRWLKGWDSIVFPGSSRPQPKSHGHENGAEERPHRKIMLLTGSPGLGKTTLAHVCAKQAGYEVVEINASDERNREVVKGRIREIVGTENVKGVHTQGEGGTVRKAGRPVCVVVDEVDGAVSGTGGGGDGGFIKALMDLIALDQKNSNNPASASGTSATRKSKKGDRFRLLRPLILICNDIYHPSLRTLRSSTMAEIIHIRKPPLEKVVSRLKFVFEKEGVSCDGDGVRRLCEAAWGISSGRDKVVNSSNTGEGDLRGILVVGEWVASKLRAAEAATLAKSARLTRSWVDKNVLSDLCHGGCSARAIGRGGAKEAVERVFQDGAGFPKSDPAPQMNMPRNLSTEKSTGVSEASKRKAIDRLREIVDMSGETDRIMVDCFAKYPSQPFQDDTYLSKPNEAYEWLHFHDTLSSKAHTGQEWELSMYLCQSTLGFHHLFATPSSRSWSEEKRCEDDNDSEPLPFSGPRADYEAAEILKQNKAILQSMQPSLSIPLFREFRSLEEISSDFLPHLTRILNPNVKPIVVGGSGEQKGMVSVRKESEKAMLDRAVGVMGTVGVTFERSRIESGFGGSSSYVYRMEP